MKCTTSERSLTSVAIDELDPERIPGGALVSRWAVDDLRPSQVFGKAYTGLRVASIHGYLSVTGTLSIAVIGIAGLDLIPIGGLQKCSECSIVNKFCFPPPHRRINSERNR